MLHVALLLPWFAALSSGLLLLIIGSVLGFGIARKTSQRIWIQREPSLCVPRGVPLQSEVPISSQIQRAVQTAYAVTKPISEGNNADYIPYLSKVPSHLFSIAIVTTEGQTYEIGDSEYAFAIESISKVFTLCLVMQEIGPDGVRQKIGADPTGQPFNSIIGIELLNGPTLNPFVNAGALVTTSLVSGRTADERWLKIIETMNRFAGRGLAINEEVYRSESATNQRNKGIAWLMESYGHMYQDSMVSTDLYTRQCSVAITTRDLAMMGASLANAGLHPVTRDRIIDANYVPFVLAQMAINGLYNATGDWLYSVGLPGKSGVSGGILAVAPGKFGIAAFSPPVDQFGNSVRGQRAVQHLSAALDLNLFAA